LVVQEKLTIHQNKVENFSDKLRSRFRQIVTERRSNLQRLTNQVEQQNPEFIIQNHLGMIESLRDRLQNRSVRILSDKDKRFKELLSKLREINPKAPLERGFSRILQDGQWVRSRAAYDSKKDLQIEWNDGVTKISKNGN
jgi:exodeoxyribonuclease VII large subunit